MQKCVHCDDKLCTNSECADLTREEVTELFGNKCPVIAEITSDENMAKWRQQLNGEQLEQ